MNKYLKILMLSGGLVGAIAPTAINMNKNENNDLGTIYDQVEKMQEALPRLSRINYKLNIDLNNDSNNSDLSENKEFIENSNSLNDNIMTNTDNLTNNEDNSSYNTSESNVTFTTTDENGKETNLSNEETINYLNETLNQTNIEYEALKTTLSKAIKDTMDYLDAYKNGETPLTNEQKIYIKEHSNSIKFLAETLEDLSEDMICCIDGCEDCNDTEEFEATTSKYLTTISELETRINTLNNAIASLQFINNMCNPFFFGPTPNYIMYEYNNDLQDNVEKNNNDLNIDNDIKAKDEQNSIDNNTNDSVNNDEITQDNAQEISEEDDLTNDTTLSTNNESDKPTTFGLKSNIDTYAPTRRNIDTFFNTALYNNEYMNGNAYGYGYGAPYGYGGSYGYAMPYGQGYYGQPYGMGLNSNLVNREELEKQQNESNHTNIMDDVGQDTNKEIKKPKKIRTKRTQNIDTYTGTTIQSNINTMGESKISRFFKEKFNNLHNKIKKQKQDTQNLPDTSTSQDNLQDTINNQNNDNSSNIPEIKNELTDRLDNQVDNQLDINTNSTNNTQQIENKDTKNNPIPHHEKDIRTKI